MTSDNENIKVKVSYSRVIQNLNSIKYFVAHDVQPAYKYIEQLISYVEELALRKKADDIHNNPHKMDDGAYPT